MANEFKIKKGLIINGSGSTLLDIQGSQGQLFSITDSLSGSLFSVNDISGMPIMEVFSDDRVLLGTFGAEAIKVSGSTAIITGSLLGTASSAITSSFSLFSSIATNATTAGSVTNSVTFNNGGSGDASGTSFNGSSARTISYNTIGAPSISGTNATGTWGISITGNANTATSASFATSSSLAANAITATNANNIAVTDTTTGTGPYYLVFTDGTTGNRIPRVDSATLTFNATTNTLTVTNLEGNSSTSTTSGLLTSEDNRTISPNELTTSRLRFGFTSWNNNNTSPYADFLHLRSYLDSSGGADNLVMFRKDAIGMRIWQQTYGSSTAYSTYKDVAFTDSNITGNANTATTLQTARNINGTSFNGSADITTSTWGTSRTITIGSTGKSVNGSTNVSWSLAEIGAAAASHTHSLSYYNSSLQNNLDTLYGTGQFGWLDTTTGRPSSYGQGINIVSSGTDHNNSNNWITQLGFGTDASTAWFRTKVNTSAWTSWFRILVEDAWINSKYFRSDGAIFGTIFYDATDSNFYVDPASTSVLNNVIIGNYTSATTRTLDFRTVNSIFTITTDGTSGALGTNLLYTWANGGQGPLRFSNALGEVMRLTPTGNLWVGGTNMGSNAKLGVSNAGAEAIEFAPAVSSNTTRMLSYNRSTLNWIASQFVASEYQWQTSGTERMRMTTNGALGLGVTPTNTAGRFEASNDIVAYSSSDKRWKKNIKNLTNPLEKILKINGVEFDWIEDEPVHGNKGHDIGVIAQEIEEILPDAVQTRESGMKAVQYDKIIPLLIEAIKEQQKQIDGLKKLIK